MKIRDKIDRDGTRHIVAQQLVFTRYDKHSALCVCVCVECFMMRMTSLSVHAESTAT